MTNTVVSYPISAYQNIPIHAEFYQPSQFFISNVSLGQQTTVTTSVNHNYVVGQLVRLIIPISFGCRQLNNAEGYVLSIPAANQILLNINSSNSDLFKTSSVTTKPQVMAIGSSNSGAINSNGRNSESTFIPGSFINISPL